MEVSDMKKQLAALFLTVAVLSGAASDHTYALYAEGRTVVISSEDYPTQLAEKNSAILPLQDTYAPNTEADASEFVQMYTERLTLLTEYTDSILKKSAELKIRLIDYDVALKALRLQIERYKDICAVSFEAESLYRLGSITKKELEAEQATREDAYHALRVAVYDISVQKAEIEQLTGEKLQDSFDFDSLYYITDVLKLNVSGLAGIAVSDTVCRPAGYAAESVAASDTAKELSDAVACYLAMSDPLRGYIAAKQHLQTVSENFMLGVAQYSELTAADHACDDAYLTVCTAKAELAKSLIRLDAALGGALISPYAVSSELISVYGETLCDEARGTGLFYVYRAGESRVLLPLVSPHTVSEDEDYLITYTVSYGDTVIGSSKVGVGCVLSEAEYSSDEKYATVTFMRDSVVLGTYKIDVFSPIGGFIK